MEGRDNSHSEMFFLYQTVISWFDHFPNYNNGLCLGIRYRIYCHQVEIFQRLLHDGHIPRGSSYRFIINTPQPTCWYHVEAVSQTVVQHYVNIGSTFNDMCACSVLQLSQRESKVLTFFLCYLIIFYFILKLYIRVTVWNCRNIFITPLLYTLL